MSLRSLFCFLGRLAVLALGIIILHVPEGGQAARGQSITRGQGIGLGSDLIQQMTMQPGGRSGNDILVENTSDSTRTVSIEKRDFRFSYSGSRSFPSPGSLDRSNASWISLSSNLVTIPPDTTVAVGYQIQVPSRASPQRDSLYGTYWSALLVEPAQGTERTQQRIQINESVRYAVQIITHIGTTGQKSVSLLNTDLRAEGKGRRLIVDLKHNGTRSFDPDVYLELYGGTGSLVGKFGSESRLLYPSTSARYEVNIDSVKAGSYTGMLIIDGGQGALFGAQLDLEL